MNKRILFFLFIAPFIVCGCSRNAPKSTLLANEATESKATAPDNVLPPEAADRIQFRLRAETLIEAEGKYGFAAYQRLKEWEAFIRNDTSRSDMEKLEKVNVFFNKLDFIDDYSHWGQPDYWATPVEFLASNGGDCEDFSLAKYFTLIAMGVNKRRLSLTYVKKLDADESHMVMTYYEVPGEEPLILDNVTDEILLATNRPDLLPVYNVNDSGLWRAETRSHGHLVGRNEDLSRWKELLTRLTGEFL